MQKVGECRIVIREDGQGDEREVGSLPLVKGTLGGAAVDIRGMFLRSKLITFDPGFTATASCESAISFIDGAEGRLLYRGYPIEQLVEQSDFYESSFLLLFGSLPSQREYERHCANITSHTLVHEQLTRFFSGFKSDAHPMAIMCGVVGALSAFYHDSLDIHQQTQRELSAYRLIAKMPTIAAMAFRTANGMPIVYPRNDYSYSENFLHMMFSVPSAPYHVNPVFAKALDQIFIAHLDHGQNASTSTVRIAGSSDANPFACIAAGIASLWGPSHGGANEKVLDMLEEIGTVDQIPHYITLAKSRTSSFRLWGFGHRVYKSRDPRAKIMQKVAHSVLSQIGLTDDPLLNIARELERIALSDEYFIKRKLYPNVDFYSGIVFKALKIPRSMFTVLFAVARTTGWVAHWLEMVGTRKVSISRPRQIYTGATVRDFVVRAERKEPEEPEKLRDLTGRFWNMSKL